MIFSLYKGVILGYAILFLSYLTETIISATEQDLWGIISKRYSIHIIIMGINLVKVNEYKNLSWVWGQDRKIRPDDRHLASRGLPSDDKWWSRGTAFSILPSHE